VAASAVWEQGQPIFELFLFRRRDKNIASTDKNPTYSRHNSPNIITITFVFRTVSTFGSKGTLYGFDFKVQRNEREYETL
jgi:hypothetical protein